MRSVAASRKRNGDLYWLFQISKLKVENKYLVLTKKGGEDLILRLRLRHYR